MRIQSLTGLRSPVVKDPRCFSTLKSSGKEFFFPARDTQLIGINLWNVRQGRKLQTFKLIRLSSDFAQNEEVLFYK